MPSGGYINGHPGNKMMLTGVSYSDGTSANYNYTTDNVPENGTSHKLYPLLSTANDKRYNGPMRQIAYDYSNGSPHGVIYQEKYNANGPLVSQIEPAVPLLTADGPMPNEFTETRGDGPSRTFHYTNFNQHHRCDGCGICEDYEDNDHWPDRGPQQVLKWYTDFLGLQENTTWLGYDSHWYVNSVTDARGSGPGDASYTTTYTRGPPPPQGIGQIKKITHPDGYFIQYDYEDPTPQTGDPHYITRITDERGNKTEHIRDGDHRIIHTDHKDSQGNILAYEEFQYNNFGQVKTHHLPSTVTGAVLTSTSNTTAEGCLSSKPIPLQLPIGRKQSIQLPKPRTSTIPRRILIPLATVRRSTRGQIALKKSPCRKMAAIFKRGTHTNTSVYWMAVVSPT